LKNFILGLEIVDNIVKPLKIYCDNSTTLFFFKNKYFKGAKHMKLKFFVVKEVQKHRVSIEHVNIDLMMIGSLTKGLPHKVFTDHVENMDMCISECCY